MKGLKLKKRAQKNGPLFIVGSPRSGTTLLQYILRSHPRISMPTGESHFIIPLHRNRHKFGDLRKRENVARVLAEMYRISPEFLDTDLQGMKFDMDKLSAELVDEGRDTIASIVEGLFRKNAAGEGKVRWGDKTPYYVLHMRTIIELFPDAQIIHLIRDGRDCALSMFVRGREFGVYNSYHAAKYWQQYVETGKEVGRALGSGVYLELKYEDILEDQLSAMKKICAFLGEDFDHSLINFEKSSIAGKTPLLQKDVQKDNAGKWRKKMTRGQIRVFESAAGDTLRENGYELATSARKFPLPVRAAFRMHNRLINWYTKKFVNGRR